MDLNISAPACEDHSSHTASPGHQDGQTDSSQVFGAASAPAIVTTQYESLGISAVSASLEDVQNSPATALAQQAKEDVDLPHLPPQAKKSVQESQRDALSEEPTAHPTTGGKYVVANEYPAPPSLSFYRNDLQQTSTVSRENQPYNSRDDVNAVTGWGIEGSGTEFAQESRVVYSKAVVSLNIQQEPEEFTSIPMSIHEGKETGEYTPLLLSHSGPEDNFENFPAPSYYSSNRRCDCFRSCNSSLEPPYDCNCFENWPLTPRATACVGFLLLAVIMFLVSTILCFSLHECRVVDPDAFWYVTKRECDWCWVSGILGGFLEYVGYVIDELDES